MPLRGTSILRLRRAPFGFIGRRPSGQARRLFGWSQTRESLCRTPVSKGLLVSYAILYFHFSACSLRRLRARQRSYGFAFDDDTEWRFAQLSYRPLRRRVPLRGTSILRLRRAPFGFIGRRPSGQARRLFGWSQTRESLCRTPVSKGLLVWHVIPCFRFSSCAFTRIRARQRAHGFASDDDTEWRFAQLSYWSLRRSSCHSILRRLQGLLS